MRRVDILRPDRQCAAIGAMRRALAALGRDGTTESIASEMVSFAEREGVAGAEHRNELNRRCAE